MSPRTGLDDVEKRNVLLLPGIEPQTSSPLLYRLGISLPLVLTYENASCFPSRTIPFQRNGKINRHAESKQ
jgi:hypothetical protein